VLTDSLPASLVEIAALLAEGLTDKEIAGHTGRPLSTVRTYVARLYERTGLRSRAAVTKWWWTSVAGAS
jgi:DNA-binding NarL/FixJ family response regulator